MNAVNNFTSDNPLLQVLARLNGVKRSGNRYLARCPAHKDRSPSLSVREGNDGKILIYCFAGCETRDIMAAMGLNMQDLFPTPNHSWRSRTREEMQQARRRKLELQLERRFAEIEETASQNLLHAIRETRRALDSFGWSEIALKSPRAEALAKMAHDVGYMEYLTDLMKHKDIKERIAVVTAAAEAVKRWVNLVQSFLS